MHISQRSTTVPMFHVPFPTIPCHDATIITYMVSHILPSARVQHATNDFCIAPRLAESGAHCMDGFITPDSSMKEPSAQVQHATNDFCIAPRVAECGAHNMDCMDGFITPDSLMKEPSAQVQHATNHFCIAPRLAESSAHNMDGLITPDLSMK